MLAIPTFNGGPLFAVRRFSAPDHVAVRRWADGSSAGLGGSVVTIPAGPIPTARFNARQLRRRAVRAEVARRAVAEANRLEMARRTAGRFDGGSSAPAMARPDDPAPDREKARSEWRAVHGRRSVQPVRRAGYVEPSEMGGLLVDDDNRAIIVRTDSGGSDTAGWTVTAPVRRFFARRNRHTIGPDGPAPCLVYEVLQAGPDGAIIRVDGPAREIERYFGPSFGWPGWVREVHGRDNSRVLQSPLPTENIVSATAVNQSEVKRDRFARMPAHAGPKVKSAVRYKRAGQWQRRAMAPDGPRPVLG